MGIIPESMTRWPFANILSGRRSIRKGSRIDGKTSVFGPYSDKLLIPQLIELAVDYKLDGAWVDGDCWATVIDNSVVAKNAFTQQTGVKTIPTRRDDPNWFLWDAVPSGSLSKISPALYRGSEKAGARF